ncbi:hypothetical protein ABES03_09865 [Neobacillus rhizosphaerae]|uniref:hypothetical protein n=1 Tax=Neobacillus rhizosphaerae TaxID=2880965 RepID=UPI003D2DE3BF
MNFKKIMIATTLLLGVTYGSTFAYNYSQPVKQFNGHGKREQVKSLDDMENKASLIVIGQKLDGEKATVLDDGDRGILAAWTVSDFKIKKIIKNSTSNEYTKNDVIQVHENAAEDMSILGKKMEYSLDGYEKMNKGKKYVLFLRESRGSNKDNLIPISAIYGKVPLDAKDGALEYHGESEVLKQITKDGIKKYKKELDAID